LTPVEITTLVDAFHEEQKQKKREARKNKPKGGKR